MAVEILRDLTLLTRFADDKMAFLLVPVGGWARREIARPIPGPAAVRGQQAPLQRPARGAHNIKLVIRRF